MKTRLAMPTTVFLLATALGCQGTAQKKSAPIVRSASGAPVTSAAKTQGAGGHMWKMKKVSQETMIGLDPVQGYPFPPTPKRQVTAISMLIPSDWTFKVIPPGPPDCSQTQGRLGVIAASPDDKAAFVSFAVPDTAWSNNPAILRGMQQELQRWHQSMPACTLEPPKPLAQRMPELIRKLLGPTVTVSGELQPVPALSEKLPAMVQQANQQADAQARGMAPMHLEAQAGRLRVQVTGGSESGEGWVYALQVVRAQPSPMGGAAITTSLPMFFMTGAPTGELDGMEKLFATMAGSMEVGAEYQAESLEAQSRLIQIHQITDQRLARIASEMAADNARTAANIANIQAGVQQYRSQVMSDVAANRSAALSHSSQQYALFMGDQAQYRDPGTGQSVILPNTHNNVWASTTGNTNEYILTDSPSFNPNGQVGSGSWTQMQAVR